VYDSFVGVFFFPFLFLQHLRLIKRYHHHHHQFYVFDFGMR